MIPFTTTKVMQVNQVLYEFLLSVFVNSLNMHEYVLTFEMSFLKMLDLQHRISQHILIIVMNNGKRIKIGRQRIARKISRFKNICAQNTYMMLNIPIIKNDFYTLEEVSLKILDKFKMNLNRVLFKLYSVY